MKHEIDPPYQTQQEATKPEAYKLAVKRNPTPRGATARSMYKILTGSTVP